MSSTMTRTRRLAIISMLSTLSFVGRMTFSFLPNVQPVTTIIILITVYAGFKDGLLVAIISILMSNIYLGMGVWTIAQIVSYSLIVIIVRFLSSLGSSKEAKEAYLPLIGIVSGLLYGLFISLVQAPFFGWASFVPYYLSGLPYDFSHAIGNYLFAIILSPILKPIITAHYDNIRKQDASELI